MSDILDEFADSVSAAITEVNTAELVDEDRTGGNGFQNPVMEVKPATPMTQLETKIAELYSLGKSTKGIAAELGVAPTAVSNILSKPHIKAFVTELINAQYTASTEGRLRIINKIIDDKLLEIERKYGDNYAKATKKDIVDLLAIEDAMLKERQKKELGMSENTYVTVLNQILKD